MLCPYCQVALNENGICPICFERVETHTNSKQNDYRTFLKRLPNIIAQNELLKKGFSLVDIGLYPK